MEQRHNIQTTVHASPALHTSPTLLYLQDEIWKGQLTKGGEESSAKKASRLPLLSITTTSSTTGCQGDITEFHTATVRSNVSARSYHFDGLWLIPSSLL